MDKHKLLIIDDDVEYLKILAESLEDDFEVTCANTISVADALLRDKIKFDADVA